MDEKAKRKAKPNRRSIYMFSAILFIFLVGASLLFFSISPLNPFFAASPSPSAYQYGDISRETRIANIVASATAAEAQLAATLTTEYLTEEPLRLLAQATLTEIARVGAVMPECFYAPVFLQEETEILRNRLRSHEISPMLIINIEAPCGLDENGEPYFRHFIMDFAGAPNGNFPLTVELVIKSALPLLPQHETPDRISLLYQIAEYDHRMIFWNMPLDAFIATLSAGYITPAEENRLFELGDFATIEAYISGE